MIESEQVEDKPVRPFAILWGGQAVSLLGTRVVRFALVWWITDLTGSATVLAIATIMAILPQVFVAPFAGSYVDRANRRRVMIVADSLTALTILSLAFLFAIGLAEIWHVFVIMFIGATLGAFHFPAMQASTTLMVPKKHYARIGGLNQALNGLTSIAAPPIGAVLYALFPLGSILLVDVTTAIVAVAGLAIISIPQPVRKRALSETSVLEDMKEGLEFLKDWRGGFFLVILAMLLNFLSMPAFSLSPILVKNHFLGSADDLAVLQSFGAVAMVIGGVVLTVWGGGKRKIVTALVALVLEGVITTLLGLVPSDSFLVAILFYAMVSFLNPIVNGALIAIFQATIPPEKQGRVFALIISGATAMGPIGLALGGPLSDIFGVTLFFIISGVGTTVLSIASFSVSPLMKIEEYTEAREPGEEIDEGTETIEETPKSEVVDYSEEEFSDQNDP